MRISRWAMIGITGFVLPVYVHAQTEFRLGEATEITIGTVNLEASVAFYEALGFNVVAEDVTPNPWAQITDGSLLILLNQDGKKYMGITYFSALMDQKVSTLEKMGIVLYHKTEKDGKFFQGIFATPDGFLVSLVKYDPAQMYQPSESTFRDLRKEDYSVPEKFPNSRIGIYGEISIPVEDLRISMAFWNQLGFYIIGGHSSPYPTTILTDGKNVIGLHETRDFTRPAITFFAPDMPKRINQLKEAGMTGFEVLHGQTGNGSRQWLNTPEGQMIFLFSI